LDSEEVGEGSLPTVAGTAELPADLGDYPVRLGVVRSEEYHRWMPLIKWLLLFPHYFVLVFLGIGALFVWLAAAVAVIVTGEYPRGMWNYLVGVLRWAMRVSAYHYLMVDEYPPFTLDDAPDYPARLQVRYPEAGVERWRPLVTWLLIFPYAIVTAALLWVAGLMGLIAFFSILFTRVYPTWAFEIVEVAFRWNARSAAYAYFTVTRYPPFAWG